MKTVSGTPKINAVFLGEINIDLLSVPDVHMVASIGYVDTRTGRRFGSFQKIGGWSPKTLAALNAFIEAMEEDAAADVFEGGEATSGGIAVSEPTSDGVPGL